MAEINMGTLYDMNKNVIANLSPLGKGQIRETLNSEVSEYLKDTDNTYYMMLCHEARDYTVFRISDYSSIPDAIKELKECLNNRGELYSIAKDTNGAIEIWIKGTGFCEYLEKDKFYMYYLFPYDAAIIEV